MRAMLIYNPAAGPRQIDTDLHEGVSYLEGQGWEVSWRQTLGPGDATTYAREAVAAGYDMAVAAGGDGTIGQVVNGLVGTSTALGVLPVGTSNVWAREVGIPLNSPFNPRGLQDAFRILAEGESRRVDVGRVNGHYFLMWVGVGFDAAVSARVEENPATKRRLGMAAFAIAIIAQTRNLTGTRTTMLLDGQRIRQRIIMIVASNIRLYAGIMELAPMASLSDGLLDVYLFKGYSGVSAWRHIFSLLTRTHGRDPEITYYRGRSLRIETSKALLVQADGDVIGHTPVDVELVPGALQVVVPRDASSPALRENWV
jgi:diacylglycerol kinase (ATP)